MFQKIKGLVSPRKKEREKAKKKEPVPTVPSSARPPPPPSSLKEAPRKPFAGSKIPKDHPSDFLAGSKTVAVLWDDLALELQGDDAKAAVHCRRDVGRERHVLDRLRFDSDEKSTKKEAEQLFARAENTLGKGCGLVPGWELAHGHEHMHRNAHRGGTWEDYYVALCLGPSGQARLIQVIDFDSSIPSNKKSVHSVLFCAGTCEKPGRWFRDFRQRIFALLSLPQVKKLPTDLRRLLVEHCEANEPSKVEKLTLTLDAQSFEMLRTIKEKKEPPQRAPDLNFGGSVDDDGLISDEEIEEPPPSPKETETVIRYTEGKRI